MMSVPIPGTDQVLEMVWFPTGVYAVGSPADEEGREDDEGLPRMVDLTGFWISTTEVTADAYAPFRHRNFDDGSAVEGVAYDADAVTRPSPPYEDPGHGLGDGSHPATGMTRWNALHYAWWLSSKTGRFFRLPTEAEWEVACRIGWEDAEPALESAEALAAVAWYEANAGDTHRPVATREPSAWGLHDMSGNVAEWVLDDYDAAAWADVPAQRAGDPRVGGLRRGRGLVKGGAFDDPAARVRCGERTPEASAWKRRDPQIPKSRWWNTDAPHVGFRLVVPTGVMSRAQVQEWFEELLGG
jgi:formylglycine-generating enzyme required for sulfatase activity